MPGTRPRDLNVNVNKRGALIGVQTRNRIRNPSMPHSIALDADGNEIGPNCLLCCVRSADDHSLEPTAAVRTELTFVSVLSIASTMIC